MQYLLMIYANEAEYAKIDPATLQKVFEEYGAFTQGIVKSGNFKAGDRLQNTDTATTVRVRDGKTLTTDGPFAETREQLGGYYLVEAKDLDAALAICDERLDPIPGADFRRRLCRRSIHQDVAAVAQPGRERAGLDEAHRAQPAIDTRVIGCDGISHRP